MSYFQQSVSPVGLAQDRWGVWCRTRWSSPGALREELMRYGMSVDIRTAQRWFQGETLPSMSRCVELTACGLGDAVHAALEPVELLGNAVRRRHEINLRKARLREQQREIADMEAMDQAIRERTGIARGDEP